MHGVARRCGVGHNRIRSSFPHQTPHSPRHTGPGNYSIERKFAAPLERERTRQLMWERRASVRSGLQADDGWFVRCGPICRTLRQKARSAARHTLQISFLTANVGQPNTRDFRCLCGSRAYRLWYSVSIFESVFLAAAMICGHSCGPRVAAGAGARFHGPRPRRRRGGPPS